MTAKKDTPSLSDVLNKKNDEVTPDSNENYVEDSNNPDPFLSSEVVATVPNKTPDELAAETPDETAARYNIDSEITKEDAKNPRVQAYESTVTRQVPSGTHLHPDIAKSSQNRGIAEMHTDNALVRHQDTAPTYDFAPDADVNDKFQKPAEEDVKDSDV